MAAPSQMHMPGSLRRAQCPVAMPLGIRVPSSESLNPDNSSSRECGHVEDSVHTTQTQKTFHWTEKKLRDAQHVYEAEEADMKARGLKPHAIGYDSWGCPMKLADLVLDFWRF